LLNNTGMLDTPSKNPAGGVFLSFITVSTDSSPDIFDGFLQKNGVKIRDLFGDKRSK